MFLSNVTRLIVYNMTNLNERSSLRDSWHYRRKTFLLHDIYFSSLQRDICFILQSSRKHVYAWLSIPVYIFKNFNEKLKLWDLMNSFKMRPLRELFYLLHSRSFNIFLPVQPQVHCIRSSFLCVWHQLRNISVWLFRFNLVGWYITSHFLWLYSSDFWAGLKS